MKGVGAGEGLTSRLCLEDGSVAKATGKRSAPSVPSNPADDCASRRIKSPGRCGEPRGRQREPGDVNLGSLCHFPQNE